ncbi:hypothetical protein [Cupriavidus oxalaticus]|jgi:hypothetical protein|uniref:Uncharacterized protein n=1 Tax=Cupriavidus oxalaticus TaxID=96344 RepID=A0A375G5W1_9BURK|nr:hypothetical protein [Cupriavidus oxalaticus]QEZ47356.1 hypothetical protein D2917_24825 [Cupriavidus oxalaticus]QRQ88342.1 hypothetical protein JTE91_17305 [Cupriavidus oxalaticus]QRQ93331.1 hypothetical protein JTE92_24955 [Cupriavidus oxalaticus]WQD81949.1 hypothetical protein U0036_12700 [Cupriavidus oxalaticus]SPC13528.1 conserved hypothetical protein [Cupriavidus oxalaticus]
MTTLTIKDLSAAETLDSKRMHAVRGGLAYLPFAAVYAPIKLKLDSSIDATQSIAQMQSVTNLNGNGSAFLDHVKSNVHTNQNATNNIYG